MLKGLKFPLKGKYVVMIAPSFVVDFNYPSIVSQLKKIGFDKVVEVTFGAKMINRDYHKNLSSSKKFFISTACPGIVETINKDYPQYVKNLMPVDSPMIAMAKICKKIYPNHKIVFISPCDFKKIEAEKSDYIDAVLNYKELMELFQKFKIKEFKTKINFDKFYNDYTKIYPLAGGLSKTAHLRGILKKNEIKVIDGISKVKRFLKNPKKEIRFLDCNFCIGGCIGGPSINSKEPLSERKKKVLNYLKNSLNEDIPEPKKGLIKKAKGISFKVKKF
jgi:iron only hydrogenase large subunit-like protein